MRIRSLTRLAAGLLLLLPSTGLGQEWQVSRDRFAFLGSSLEIGVVGEIPGTLRLIRGQPGEVEVAARAVDGIASFGLSGGDPGELRLTAVGSESVEYLVVVPENVRIRVRLPDRPVAEIFGTLQDAATYRWSLPAADPPGRIIRGAVARPR